MKTYSGIFTEDTKKAYVRYSGGSKRVLSMHIKSGTDEAVDWGTNNEQSLNLALSILLDAFGTGSCTTVKCKCDNKWISEEACKAFNEEVVVHLDKNYWKINQYAVCDWVFDFIRNTQNEKELVSIS